MMSNEVMMTSIHVAETIGIDHDVLVSLLESKEAFESVYNNDGDGFDHVEATEQEESFKVLDRHDLSLVMEWFPELQKKQVMNVFEGIQNLGK
jgi:phage regulator Rha-like protein